ncbi:DNA methyltransferase, partial [Escherichia coli]|uniref:DNA methyltransferase n=1 Tax=Escherichia coli TaxID=562 RepID=UPI00207750A8
MSRFIQGDCVRVMATFPDNAVDFILTDPPYLVGFRDRSGRTIAGDVNDDWLQPASNEMYRVLKKNALMVSFYGWNRIDRFMAAWKRAGFSVVGHLVFTKNYTSKSAYVAYRHECAYILAKGRPALPQKPLPDVLGWKYSGNRHHPTEKPVIGGLIVILFLMMLIMYFINSLRHKELTEILTKISFPEKSGS